MSVFIQCTTIRIQIPIVIALFKIIQKLKLNPKHELNINSVKGSSLIYFTYSRYWSFRWLKISDPNFRRVEPFDIKHRIFESSFKSEYSKDQSFRWLKIFEESEFSEGQIFRASNFSSHRLCQNIINRSLLNFDNINEKSAYWKKRFVHPSLFPSSFTNHEMALSSSDDDFIYHYDNNNKPDSSIDRHATVPSKVRLTICTSKMGQIKVICKPISRS